MLGVETRFGLRGRVVARFAAARTHSADSSLADEGDSPWTLAVLAVALCVIATVSLFVDGNRPGPYTNIHYLRIPELRRTR